jgi:hypothetical protein
MGCMFVESNNKLATKITKLKPEDYRISLEFLAITANS